MLFASHSLWLHRLWLKGQDCQGSPLQAVSGIEPLEGRAARSGVELRGVAATRGREDRRSNHQPFFYRFRRASRGVAPGQRFFIVFDTFSIRFRTSPPLLLSTPRMPSAEGAGSWSGEPWQSWPLSHKRWSHRLWDAHSTTVPPRDVPGQRFRTVLLPFSDRFFTVFKTSFFIVFDLPFFLPFSKVYRGLENY